jgi:hypothetical protein
MKLKYFLRHFLSNFDWMKVYLSPFKPPIPKLYIGKVEIGTPYFYPRVWDKNGKAKPKKIGFDFVDLGWKTKWEHTDYRFEWAPVWSFVFFKWQVAITFVAPHQYHYWECWLYYSRDTDKKLPVKYRIKQAKTEFPCVWVSTKDGKEVEINYWDLILKTKCR